MPLDPSGVPSRAGIQAAIDEAVSAAAPPGAWASYVPVLSGWTLNNGTLAGFYTQVQRTVHYRITYTVGSSDTLSGAIRLTTPSVGQGSVWAPMGRASLQDVSASARHFREAAKVSSASNQILLADATATQVTNTVPFTFATGDIIQISGAYEAV